MKENLLLKQEECIKKPVVSFIASNPWYSKTSKDYFSIVFPQFWIHLSKYLEKGFLRTKTKSNEYLTLEKRNQKNTFDFSLSIRILIARIPKSVSFFSIFSNSIVSGTTGLKIQSKVSIEILTHKDEKLGEKSIEYDPSSKSWKSDVSCVIIFQFHGF